MTLGRSDRQLRAAGAAAILLAVAIRLVVAVGDDSLPTKDAQQYDQLGQRLAAGDGFVDERGEPTAYRPPLYPLFLASVYRVAGYDHRAVRLVQALVSVGTVVAIGVWAMAIGGERAAVIATFLSAVYVPFYGFYFSSSALLTETLYTLLLTLSLLTVSLYLGTPRFTVAALSGVAFGLAILCRGVALPLLLALPFALAVLGVGVWRTVQYMVGALPVAALIMMPWVARNYAVFGELVPLSTNGGGSFYASNHLGSDGFGTEFYGEVVLPEDAELRRRGLSEPERSRHFMAKGMAFVRANPGAAARLWLRKAMLYLDPFHSRYNGDGGTTRTVNWSYVAVASGAALGVVLALRWGMHRRQVLLLAFAFAVPLGFHAVFHSAHRYRLPSEPCLIVLTALALENLWARFAARA